jgi:hypothetical protein
LSLKIKVDDLWVVWPQNHSDDFSSIWASKPMATVCEWFDIKTTRTVFTGLASKPVATVSSGLASKPIATVFSSLASKLVAMIYPVWPQNWWSISWLSLKTKVVEGFPVWTSKPAAPVWWFGTQNHRDILLVWDSKHSGFRFVGCTKKSTEGGRRGTHVEI